MRRLGYYGAPFPFPQGASAGPYPRFVGLRPRVPCVLMVAPKKNGCGCGSHGPCHCKGRRRPRRGLRGLGDSSAGLPAGSTLVYNATWPNSLISKISTLNTAGGSGFTESAVAAGLPALGIIVDSSNTTGSLTTGTSGFTLNIHTSIDFGQAADVQSIIDHQVYLALGEMPQSAITTTGLAAPIPNSGVNAPGTNATAAAQDLANYNAALAAGDATSAAIWLQQYQVDSGTAPATNATLSWIENNPAWVAGGILALVLLWKLA